MTKVVKSDLTHPAGFEQLRETLRYIVRLDQVADFIDAYIIQILAVVAATAETAVFLLLFFQSQKPLSDKRDKRKRSQAGLCFRRISRDKNTLAVDVAGSYRVPDREGVMLEVNGIRHPLTEPGFTLGRGTDADVRINDPGISRLHARISVHGARDPQVTIEDMGSTNGIVVDGRRVQSASLREGSRIELGNTRMLVRSPVSDV